MRRDRDRAAWTAHIEGTPVARPNKYGNVRNGRYASLREAGVAANLAVAEKAGAITELREQVPFVLVEGNGKIRPIKYIADFTYIDGDKLLHVVDAKGYSKNQVYRLKKKMLLLLRGITIEEV